jgi:uncharacterized SAM-dependent methyltransferase
LRAGFSENNPMIPVARITIHPSQFPENVRQDLLESLRTRKVNHKFHYDSVKQTAKWLALHQAYSPSRTDADCEATYDRAFTDVVRAIKAGRVHVIGLGCGGGQKDARFLKRLKPRSREIFYAPCDVSTAMVLVARKAASHIVPENQCFPFVCDLASADALPASLKQLSPPRTTRVFTFFGMIPNFEPQIILPRLASIVGPRDTLLFSANLAPGPDYALGLKRILPQYDNPLTRDWLMTFLLDLGVERNDGEMRFRVEEGPARSGLKRIVARFHFAKTRRIKLDSRAFEFRAGDAIQLFFSFRYTPELIRRTLAKHRLAVQAEWITESEEEGVFLCRRT